jgi:AcrR family transcriptional regulator
VSSPAYPSPEMPRAPKRTRSVRRRATKGAKTRERIIETALGLASRDGLTGLTIGSLADHVGMSKGGLFAHFGSKEELQLRVVEAAVERFRVDVVEPTMAATPGVPRLRELLARWMAWDGDERLPGGCPFVAFATELDEQPGGARDALVDAQKRWMAFLVRLGGEAVEAGALRATTDLAQFSFLLHGVLLSYHQAAHLLRDPTARANAERALQFLLEPCAAPTVGTRTAVRPGRRR